MGEVATAYVGVRERMVEILGHADPAAIVPACPEWSVKDLAAHVTGVVDDALAGRLEGAGSDPWTEAQVSARRAASVQDIITEWTQKAPAFEGILDGIGATGHQAVFDVTTHEHDLRGAVGEPGAHDSDAVRIALGWLAPQAVATMGSLGRPPLRLRTTEGDEWSPDDAPQATLIGSRFELLRALSGRRSRSQIRSLDWEGSAGDYLEAFELGPFRTPSHDIID